MALSLETHLCRPRNVLAPVLPAEIERDLGRPEKWPIRPDFVFSSSAPTRARKRLEPFNMMHVLSEAGLGSVLRVNVVWESVSPGCRRGTFNSTRPSRETTWKPVAHSRTMVKYSLSTCRAHCDRTASRHSSTKYGCV